MGTEHTTNRLQPKLATRPAAPGTETTETMQRPNGTTLPQVEISMFTPNHLLRRRDLLEKFYGNAGSELVERITRNKKGIFDPQVQELIPSVNAHFFKAMAEEFHLPETTDPKEFYRTSMQAANAAITSFNDSVFPIEERTVGALNEITAFDGNPSTMLYYLTARGIAPRLRFEVERQFKLARIAAAIESRARNSGFSDELAKMQQIFDLELFEGAIGFGKTITSYSWHDSETNHVLTLTSDRSPRIFFDYSNPDKPRPISPQEVHLKKHAQHVRTVDGIGEVFADLNSKQIGSAINKAVRKAYRDKQKGGEGTIDIDTGVHDAIRAKMVVQGTENIDDPKIDALIQKVTGIIERNSGTTKNKPLGELEYIERDDEKNDNNDIRFKRIQIKFSHVSTPIEIIFYDEKSSLEEELQVGKRDEITGHFNGYAHSLYEVRRLADIMGIYYPVQYYPPPNGDTNYLEHAAMLREEQIADELRYARRVRPLAQAALVYSRNV